MEEKDVDKSLRDSSTSNLFCSCYNGAGSDPELYNPQRNQLKSFPATDIAITGLEYPRQLDVFDIQDEEESIDELQDFVENSHNSNYLSARLKVLQEIHRAKMAALKKKHEQSALKRKQRFEFLNKPTSDEHLFNQIWQLGRFQNSAMDLFVADE